MRVPSIRPSIARFGRADSPHDLTMNPAHENAYSSAALAPRPPRKKRLRLPPDIRIGQILDAAYEAFSTRGFPHTRIDDIAALAGLSKGGIYAHFDSKDEIFQALLDRSFGQLGIGKRVLSREAVTVERVVELLADRLYTWAVSEPAVTTLRMLIAEGSRVPDTVQRWRRHMEETIVASVGKLIAKGVREGTLRDGIAAQSPSLLIAPVMQACLSEVMRTAPGDVDEIDRERGEYACFLRALLSLR